VVAATAVLSFRPRLRSFPTTCQLHGCPILHLCCSTNYQAHSHKKFSEVLFYLVTRLDSPEFQFLSGQEVLSSLKRHDRFWGPSSLLFCGYRLFFFLGVNGPWREVNCSPVFSGGTRWRSWLKHCATSQKVAGSNPDEVTGIFQWLNPSGRTMALGSTQPLTEMSTRNPSWE
jgi:hypothetical protein